MGIVARIVVLLGVGPAFPLALALPQGGPLQCISPTKTLTTTFPVLQCHYVCIPPESVCSPGELAGKTPDPARTTTVTSPNDCTAVVQVNHNGGCGLCATCVSANPGGPIVTASATTTLAYINPGGPIISAISIPTGPAYVNPGGPIVSAISIPTGPAYVNPGGPIVSAISIPTGPAYVNPGGPIITHLIIPTPPAYACPTLTTVSTTASSLLCECLALPEKCPAGETISVPALPTSTVTAGCTVRVVAGPGCQCQVCA